MNFLFSIIARLRSFRFVLFLQPSYHFFLAYAAAVCYEFPSRKMTVIGVTGTKGKTTVVELLHSILSLSGNRVASVSSLRFRINNEEIPNHLGMTMPGRFFLQRFFFRARRAGCNYVVIEVTSQGVEQYRHRFIHFNVGVMTNISPEHIESHGGFEPYIRAKLDFFWRLPKHSLAVINYNSPYYERFGAATAVEKCWYGMDAIKYKKNIWFVRNYQQGINGTIFDMKGCQIKSSLHGDFNAQNILAAVAVSLALRIPLEKIAQGVKALNVMPGRMEIIQQTPFSVIVDYAHTPDSLENVYRTLQREVAVEARENRDSRNARIICVLGAAGGGRDIWKRPEFGKIAAVYCQEIIITNEDPFNEPPEKIMQDIADGVRQSEYTGALSIIIDRREAIHNAIFSACEGDKVIITGKGSESFIRGVKGERVAWDDRVVVREELTQKG